MADYQGLIRVGVQGLGEIRQLNTALERANELFGNLENAQIIAGQIGESATRNVNRAAQRRAQAGRDLARANRIVENTAMRRDPRTGLFLPGGPNATARRLAGRNERLAQREVLQSDRALREELRNQRLVWAAQRRYAGALNSTADAIDGLQGQIGQEQARLEAALAGIARGSRGNYLTNLFQGRQAALARGGGGRNLSPNLQEQIRANRSAWDLATAGGRENLQLMSRLATELSGLVRQQNEFNRRRANRSVSYETGRRGQERIDDLSRMAGAEPAKIKRLRTLATNVISAGLGGDTPETQLATRRMNASIARYERELRAAARELQIARARGGPRSPIRGGVNVQGSPAYIERMARIGGARESIKGRKDLPGSPAYIEERQRQLQRAIRAGGAREGIKGRKDLPGSPAYIEEQKKQLQRAIRAGGPKESIKGRKDVVGSPAYLEEQRKQQAQQLQRAIRAGGPRESIKGRKELPGSPAYIEEQRKQQAQQLQRAIRAGGPRESVKGRKDVVGSPAYYEEQQRQLQRAIRAGGPKESVKGRKDLPGSPAYIEEQQRQLARAIRAGGPRESIKGRKDVVGSPAYLEAEQKERERVARLRQIASPIRGTATMVGSPAYFEAQERARRSQQVSRKLGPASPIRGTETMVGSPAYIAAQERQQKAQRAQGFFRGNARKAVGEGLIGGAFPLLFGQGLGASIGGAVGGGFGGAIGGSFGFGLSLAGTAIGQAVDTTASNLKELASALKSPADAITALETSGFRVGDSLKLQVQQLQSVGRAYDAQTIVLQEVQKRLGPGSLTELRQLDAAQKKLQEQYAAIAAEIQVRLLPVLQGFVEFLGIAAGDIGGFASQSRLQRLDPAKFEELRSQAIRESSGFAFNIAGVQLGFNGSNQKKEARLSELSKQELSRRFANERAQVPLSAEQKLEGEITRLNESRKIADQIQSAYREAFNLQRQAHDLQRDGADLNREIADYSYRKEREIFDLKQQAAEKQIENNRAAAQNRIERGDLDARQTFAAAVGFEQQLLTNVREVMRTRMEGEADIEQSRSKLELAMARLNRDVEDYKRTSAREVEDIERRKLAYARSVEDYKMRVADYVLQRSRESADLMRQAMTLPSMDGGAAGGGSAIGGSKLSQLIGSTESYGGNYGAFNRGGSNNGHTAHGSGIDPSLANMTIAEIQRRQLAPGVPAGQQLHAVGKYQIIGSTMRSLMQGNYGPTGVSASDRFTPDVQEKLGSALARNRVMGKTVEEGMRGLRQEWIGLQNVSDAKLREAVVELQKTGSLQGQAAGQISSIAPPQFNPAPIGATPSAAPANAARMAVAAVMGGNEQQAQRILEDQNKLKLRGVELGQIEQILQANQLPQLQQQEQALRLQIEARRKNLGLSDDAAAAVDMEAEGVARVKQIEAERAAALSKVQKQYGNDLALVKQVNEQADLGVKIAKEEERQRRTNLGLNNELQNAERVRSEILQLQEVLAAGRVEAAALERGELQATAVELLKASSLYQQAGQAQKDKLIALVAETEELKKQNEFKRRINELDQDIRFAGAGLRAGFVGAPARAFEQGLKDFDGDMGKATQLANRTRLLEDEQAAWGNLERNIVDVSNAISGSLTNGLVDIVGGARKIEDVGRDMLNSIARSFAGSAEQQLTTLMQRQLGSLLGGAQGPLVKMLGAGGEVAGSQALGAASVAASGSLWGVSSAAAAAGVALQTIAAQAAFSGGLGGLGGIGSLGGIGQIFSGAAPDLFSKAIPDFIPSLAFGGFLANGGTTRPGEGYVVGENEPEFFFPGVSGRVVPRSDMQKAEELRQGSEQAEPIDLRYTVTEQQGERYVTEQQFRKGMEQTTKRAQAMTYAGMRNNREVRNFVDI